MDIERIRLGRFRERDPEPQFVVRLEPDEPETVVHNLSKFGDGEEYVLYMQVQNFGDLACEVTIERV